mmetsp:Transcript_9584/g.23530  ORF Transcript_9584/g.23530 Transcript_9584/m.23530 type:complete len:212 (-) Transcript_9584:824-1459(-)
MSASSSSTGTMSVAFPPSTSTSASSSSGKISSSGSQELPHGRSPGALRQAAIPATAHTKIPSGEQVQSFVHEHRRASQEHPEYTWSYWHSEPTGYPSHDILTPDGGARSGQSPSSEEGGGGGRGSSGSQAPTGNMFCRSGLEMTGMPSVAAAAATAGSSPAIEATDSRPARCGTSRCRHDQRGNPGPDTESSEQPQVTAGTHRRFPQVFPE